MPVASQRSRPSAPPPERELNEVDGLVQLSFLVQNALARHAAEQRLSLAQTRLLGILRDREPTMNELAKLMELDKSSITGLIDRAERRSLVERIASPADRRAVLVRLTDEGRSLVSQVSACFEADVSKVLERLPASDRDALSRLVSRALVAYASNQGVDLFATIDSEQSSRSQPDYRQGRR
jgi:MarR family transcriptional regulator, lower aerobic nicotinate degradation pathway regulator